MNAEKGGDVANATWLLRDVMEYFQSTFQSLTQSALLR
jgi:hypothetical protein